MGAQVKHRVQTRVGSRPPDSTTRFETLELWSEAAVPGLFSFTHLLARPHTGAWLRATNPETCKKSEDTVFCHNSRMEAIFAYLLVLIACGTLP